MSDKTLQAGIVGQWNFTSGKRYANPFADVDFDVLVEGPGRRQWRVPGFWAGDKRWAFRFAAPVPGKYTFTTLCSDVSDTGLHGRTGQFRATAYRGDHPLLHHGPLRVSPDRRRLAHADGKAFFWLGDTWWLSLTDRIRWPGEFRMLLKDRLAKGFTVVQVVAGLYPDMDWGDRRGANEAGLPYDRNFSRINPRWYDMADRKLIALSQSGIVPCIVGCWGYHLPWMGLEKMKRHWRHLVARYGAYPVLWCLAGEATMPYYKLAFGPQADPAKADEHRALQKSGWTEMARYVRGIDPFGRLIGLHPSQSARDCVTDDRVLDFNMLQTGHGGYGALPGTLKVVSQEWSRRPAMPVIQSEVSYEGAMNQSRDDVVRATFWVSLLNGAAGFTYGAMGLWQFSSPEHPYGPSPHGCSWGNHVWKEAMHWPGSTKVGQYKRLLERYPWWRMQPHPEWIDDAAPAEHWDHPQAAGIPGELVIVYYHHPKAPWEPAQRGRLAGLGSRGRWRGRWIDADCLDEYDIGPITADAKGKWTIPPMPIIGSMILILERDQRPKARKKKQP